jgi:hypothetical protein
MCANERRERVARIVINVRMSAKHENTRLRELSKVGVTHHKGQCCSTMVCALFKEMKRIQSEFQSLFKIRRSLSSYGMLLYRLRTKYALLQEDYFLLAD